MEHYDLVIGLEVHIQLATQSKLFSGSATTFGATPNTQASLIDAGFPGVLPVLNKEAVRMAVLLGYAIDATIHDMSYFERKNYFYPDLPKGYQISQLQRPIVETGSLTIALADMSQKTIRINRAHLEEDAGKSLHEDYHGYSGIDLNRASTPLLEIVSEPDIFSAEEAIVYLKTLHHLVRYLGICDGNMQEGSFRCDVNISLKPTGSEKLGTRTELKNINSFKFIDKAIHYEANRQRELLDKGLRIIQETRLYDANKNQTFSMRSKEEANDYRYFPDPDLLPIKLETDWLDAIKQSLPELPWAKQKRFAKEYQLNIKDIDYLIQDAATADYFEKVCQQTTTNTKQVLNWLRGEMASELNQQSLTIKQCPISPQNFAKLLDRIEDNTISSKIAKTVFNAMWQSSQSADDIIGQQGLKQVSDDSELTALIKKLIDDNPQQVEQYRQGKTKVLGFFVGQIMKQTQGKANPKQANELLLALLSKN